MTSGLRFRSDIEGLRAVAVLLVIGDHLFGRPLGGFIGVDVFFVISGFLITGLLVKEGERSGRVSIREFYARRVRRILPVAVLVLVATAIASRLVFPASRAQETLTDAFWAGGFLANLRFAQQGTDYFDEGLPPSPLQHYWSLSVEEQFYVGWPLALLLLFVVGRRLGRVPVRRLVGALAALVLVASLLWCLSLTASSPTDAYFSTAARAWELSLGALLAVSQRPLMRVPEALRALAAWLGLAGIGVASVIITADTPFPGYAAVLPVAATGLVLASGNPRFGPGRTLVLGNPLVQYVGKLSYSLYLWHWPCLVIAAAYWGPSGFPYWVSAAVLPALLSVLSYHLVEDPIRRSGWLSARSPDRPPLTVAGWYRDNKRGLDIGLVGTAATALLIAGYADVTESPVEALSPLPVATAGAPEVSELSPLQQQIQTALSATSWDVDAFDPSIDELRQGPRGCTDVLPRNLSECSFGSGPRTAVVLGDSIAMAWVPAVRAALGDGWRVQMLTLSECPAVDLPTFRNRSSRGEVYEACADHRAWRLEQTRSLRPDLVITSSLPDFANRIVGVDDRGPAKYTAWQEGTAALLRALRPLSERMVVLGAPPNSGNLQTCATVRSTPSDCVSQVTQHHQRVAAAERAAAVASGATFVDPRGWFCLGGRCPAVVDGTPVMRDGTHITDRYAESLGASLRDRLPDVT